LNTSTSKVHPESYSSGTRFYKSRKWCKTFSGGHRCCHC